MIIVTTFMVLLGIALSIHTGYLIHKGSYDNESKRLLYQYESERIIILYLLGTIALAILGK